MTRNMLQHFQGCLLGGAVGDALGAAVEFDSLAKIRGKFGSSGIVDPAPCYGQTGAITDDTQLTLFTAEGLIRAHHRLIGRGVCSVEHVVWHAYLRWLQTQGERVPSTAAEEMKYAGEGWLFTVRSMNARRAPGKACLSSLASGRMGTVREPINDSKGCGGVMRIAPVGLVANEPFALGQRLAAITHGHPTGHVAAGCFAQIVSNLARGTGLPAAIDDALVATRRAPDSRDTSDALERAVHCAGRTRGTPEDVETLGGGWVAEEALAISVYCALQAKDFAHGVRIAVNHSGDSDSTGSMTGNLLGLIHGREAIPHAWLDVLELRDVIEEVAKDLWWHFAAEPRAACDSENPDACGQWARYPGA